MIKFLKQAFWTSLISNVSSVISLVCIAIIARFISPDTFGIYIFCLASREIISSICSPSLSQTYLFSDGTKNDFKNVCKINLLFSILIIIVSLIGGKIISNHFGELYFNIIIIFALLSILNNYSSIFLSIGEKKMDFKNTQIFRSLALIISLIITCIFAYKLGDDINVLILKEVSFSFILLLFSIFFYKKFNKIKKNENDNKNFTKLFNYSLRSYIPRLTEIFSYRIFDFFTASLLGKNLLGLFSQTLNIIKIPYRFLGAITDNILFVHIKDKKNKNNKIDEFCKIQYLILILILPTILIFNFFNYEIINIVLGAKWLDAVKIIGLLSIFLIILPFFNSLITIYQASDNQRFYTAANCLILSIQLLGMYFLPKNIETFIFIFCFSFLFATIFLVININNNKGYKRQNIFNILLVIKLIIALIVTYYYFTYMIILILIFLIWCNLIFKNRYLIVNIVKSWKN